MKRAGQFRAGRGKGPARGRRGATRRRRRATLTAFCVALALMMLALIGYVGWWYIHRGHIRADARRYADLYAGRENRLEITVTPMPTKAPAPADSPAAAPSPKNNAAVPAVTAEPTPAPTPEPTPVVTAEPTPVITAEPTPVITLEPTPVVTAERTPVVTPEPTPVVTPEPTPVVTPEPTPVITLEPTPVVTAERTPVVTAEPTPVITTEPTPVITAEPTIAATEMPTPFPTPAAFGADMPIVQDVLIPTPGSDTQVYALPTPPPAQPGFSQLLALNPEVVGFLEIDGMLSLPVVQRENDNEYYLAHSFEGEDSREGTLFLDGLNRLVPEDDCLIVYGHNMKNDTMFGRLDRYEDVAYLRQHSVIHFDTLYENRSYVAFAAFTASMEPGNRRYFDVRQFIFDDVEFDKFVLKLQSRSLYRVPVDVRYGDRLLLLVTCDYTNREGRFILALRAVRGDETEAGVWAQAMQATAK